MTEGLYSEKMRRALSISRAAPKLSAKLPAGNYRDIQPSDLMQDKLTIAINRAAYTPIDDNCDNYGHVFPCGSAYRRLPDGMKLEAGLLAREAGFPDGSPKPIKIKKVSLVAAAVDGAARENEGFDWVLNGFAEQCIVRDAGAIVRKTEMRSLLETWCHINERDLPPDHIWGHAMRTLGAAASKRVIDKANCHVWKNINLTDYGSFLSVSAQAELLGAKQAGAA